MLEREMELLLASSDPEEAHPRADALLCQALRAHGEERLVELFEQLERWYS